MEREHDGPLGARARQVESPRRYGDASSSNANKAFCRGCGKCCRLDATKDLDATPEQIERQKATLIKQFGLMYCACKQDGLYYCSKKCTAAGVSENLGATKPGLVGSRRSPIRRRGVRTALVHNDAVDASPNARRPEGGLAPPQVRLCFE